MCDSWPFQLIRNKKLAVNSLKNNNTSKYFKMANKLVQQQLKNIIRSLSDQELEKVLCGFEIASNSKVEKSCRMISYKW